VTACTTCSLRARAGVAWWSDQSSGLVRDPGGDRPQPDIRFRRIFRCCHIRVSKRLRRDFATAARCGTPEHDVLGSKNTQAPRVSAVARGIYAQSLTRNVSFGRYRFQERGRLGEACVVTTCCAVGDKLRILLKFRSGGIQCRSCVPCDQPLQLRRTRCVAGDQSYGFSPARHKPTWLCAKSTEARDVHRRIHGEHTDDWFAEAMQRSQLDCGRLIRKTALRRGCRRYVAHKRRRMAGRC
jgi:hypothetical protein